MIWKLGRLMSFATVGPIHCKPITHCGANDCCPVARGLHCFWDSCLIVFLPPPPFYQLHINLAEWQPTHNTHTHAIWHPGPCQSSQTSQPPQQTAGSDGRRGSAPTTHASCQPMNPPHALCFSEHLRAVGLGLCSSLPWVSFSGEKVPVSLLILVETRIALPRRAEVLVICSARLGAIQNWMILPPRSHCLPLSITGRHATPS